MKRRTEDALEGSRPCRRIGAITRHLAAVPVAGAVPEAGRSAGSPPPADAVAEDDSSLAVPSATGLALHDILSLLLLSQANGHMKAISVFLRPLQERYGWTTDQVAAIYSASFGSQAAGYYLADAISRSLGGGSAPLSVSAEENMTALIGSGLLSASCLIGSVVTGCLSRNQSRSSWIGMLVAYGGLGALGNGLLESCAFRFISALQQQQRQIRQRLIEEEELAWKRKTEERGDAGGETDALPVSGSTAVQGPSLQTFSVEPHDLAMATYLVGQALAPVWMGPVWSILLRSKLLAGVPGTLAVIGVTFGLYLPFLRFLQKRVENEASAREISHLIRHHQPPHSSGAPSEDIKRTLDRLILFGVRVFRDRPMFVYASMMMVLAAGRSILYAFAAPMLEEVASMTPSCAAAWAGALGIVPPIARMAAVWLASNFMTGQSSIRFRLLPVVSCFAAMQVFSLAPIILLKRLSARTLLFLLTVFFASGGLVHYARMLVMFSERLSPEERKSHLDFQTMIAVFAASLFPYFYGILRDRMSPSKSFTSPLVVICFADLYVILTSLFRYRKEVVHAAKLRWGEEP